MFWVNVDEPDNRKCTIHGEECRYVLKSETPYKGIGRLKCDGGWFPFPSIEEAENHSRGNGRPKDYCSEMGLLFRLDRSKVEGS